MTDRLGREPRMDAGVRAHIEDLRKRLLDLGGRNPLLNFRFAKRSRRQISVVDEVPEYLFSELAGRRSLTFRGLPDAPSDEQLVGAEQPRESALRPSRSTQELAALAGIDASYDLPPASSIAQKAAHADRFIQTRLSDDDLEAKLTHLRRAYQTCMEESGVPNLYVCFGFLEWKEQDGADSRFAPLLLLPVVLERERVGDRYVHVVTAASDEAEENLSLRLRLKRDFGLVLPDLPLGDDLGDYLAAVGRMVSQKSGWAVRRRVSLAQIQLSAQVMFEALDPDALAASQPPGLDLITRLIAGATQKDHASESAPPADVSVEVADLIPVVRDADSSQLAAIRAALDTRMLVVHGPPGTGKSQTITNLIAASLARGEKVLFVADKLAALQVVKKYLDDSGLGHFCLELHSVKANRKEVLEALERALSARGQCTPPARIEEVRRERSELRTVLDAYSTVMAAPVGALGLTVHELLWRLGNTPALPPRLSGVPWLEAATVTQGQLDADRRKLEHLEQLLVSIEHDVVDLRPWRHLDATQVGPSKQSALIASVASWRGQLHGLTSALKQGNLAYIPFSQVAAAATQLRAMPQAADVELRLLGPELGARADQVVRLLRERLAQRERLAGVSAAVIEAISRRLEACETARQTIEVYAPGARCEADLEAVARAAAHDAGTLGAAAERMRSVLSLLPAPTSGQATSLAYALVRASLLIRMAPRATLALRNAATLDDSAPSHIGRLRAERARLDIERASVAEQAPGWEKHARDKLQDAAESLRTTSWFGRLSGRYRGAKATYLSVTGGRPVDRLDMATLLERVAQLHAQEDALAEVPTLKGMAAQTWSGRDTPLEPIHSIVAWIVAVREAFPPVSPDALWVRDLLLRGDLDLLDAVRSICDADSADALDKWARKAPVHLLDESAAEQAQVAADLRRSTAVLREVGATDLLVGGEFSGVVDTAARLLAVEAALDELLPASSHDDPGALIARVERTRGAIASWVPGSLPRAVLGDNAWPERLATCRQLGAMLDRWLQDTQLAGKELSALGYSVTGLLDSGAPCSEVDELAGALSAGAKHLPLILEFLSTWREALASAPLATLLEELQHSNLPLRGLAALHEARLLRALFGDAISRFPSLATMQWTGEELGRLRTRFAACDEEFIALTRQQIASAIAAHAVPEGVAGSRRSEWTDLTLIRHEQQKQRQHAPLRQIFRRAGRAIEALTPCLMMSPTSVAQFLGETDIAPDLLVIDEASQMLPEEAALAIMRAKRMVVVGDSQQLPPTGFFSKTGFDDDEQQEDDDLADERIQVESILDMALASGAPSQRLRWHYRSRHHSLIAFSNRHFYDDSLLVFPSPGSTPERSGVHLRAVRGDYSSSINGAEADAVVAAVLDHVQRAPALSLGVVALNLQQAELIQTKLDARLEEMAPFLDRWNGSLYPFFVKNLENVQGDERDVVFVSMTYGPDGGGNLRQNFGPINGKYGHRRLNVLFTRAREQLVVFASMTGSQIRVSPASKRGVEVLRDYLTYAESGGTVLGGPSHRKAEADSPFEEAIGAVLSREGYLVERQVGVAGFFIDLGIRHPDSPVGFLCGVECDGATYHSSKHARDRDRLRQRILEGMGWRIVRIWSTDWYRDRARAERKLLADIASISPSTPAPSVYQ